MVRGGGTLLKSLGTEGLGVGVLFCVLGMSGSCGKIFSKGLGFKVGEGSRVRFGWMTG